MAEGGVKSRGGGEGDPAGGWRNKEAMQEKNERERQD